MAAVVYPEYAGPVEFAAGVGTGLFQGLAEKGKIVEDKRRWDADMEYRWAQLNAQINAGNLDRSQRERFQEMDDLRNRELQREGELVHVAKQSRGFQFEGGQNQLNRDFQGQQNAQDRIVTQRGQTLNYKAANYATTTEWKDAQARLAEEHQQYVNQDGYVLGQAQQALGGRDYNTLDQPNQQAVLDQVAQAILGTQRTNQTPGVDQASPAEKQQAYVTANDYLNTLKSKEDASYTRLEELARIQSVLNARGPTAARRKTGTSVVFLAPDAVPASWRAIHGDVGLRDPEHMTVIDQRIDGHILDLIADAVDTAASMSASSRASVLEPYVKTDVQALVATMENSDPQVYAYYQDLLAAALYPVINPTAGEALPGEYVGAE